MMGNIAPVGLGSSQLTGIIRPEAGLPNAAIAPSRSTAGTRTGSVSRIGGNSAAVTQLQQALTSLVDQLGGQAQDAKLMRLLLGLIILLALLGGSGGQTGSESTQAGNAGADRAPGNASLTLQSSSTSLFFEQTTTTISLSSSENVTNAFTPSGTSNTGGRIDLMG